MYSLSWYIMFLGHHSLMALPQDTVLVFWGKRDLPMFLVTFPPFFHLHHFKKDFPIDITSNLGLGILVTVSNYNYILQRQWLFKQNESPINKWHSCATSGTPGHKSLIYLWFKSKIHISLLLPDIHEIIWGTSPSPIIQS